jgi:hypothetical protein
MAGVKEWLLIQMTSKMPFWSHNIFAPFSTVKNYLFFLKNFGLINSESLSDTLLVQELLFISLLI